jgi:hypothetical protein
VTQEFHCHCKDDRYYETLFFNMKEAHRDNIQHPGFYRVTHIMTTFPRTPDIFKCHPIILLNNAVQQLY